MGLKIFAVCGEPSGEYILNEVLRGIRAQHGEIEIQGTPLQNSLKLLSVNGFSDVFYKLPWLFWKYLKLRRVMLHFKPHLVLLVDYPGMNVGLAQLALHHGIPVHYIAPPQLWAYRNPAARLQRLRKKLTGASLQTLFPFEREVYQPWKSLMSGHFFLPPAVSPPQGNRLLLCPGSRSGVLRRNLPLWLKHLYASGILASQTIEGITLLVPENLKSDTERFCQGYKSIEISVSPTKAFARTRFAIAFPGTITLQLFLARIPTTVWGILDAPTLWLGKKKLATSTLSLPNLLLGKQVFSEWVGVASKFTHQPPPISNPLNPIESSDLKNVWSIMGSNNGLEMALSAIDLSVFQ